MYGSTQKNDCSPAQAKKKGPQDLLQSPCLKWQFSNTFLTFLLFFVSVEVVEIFFFISRNPLILKGLQGINQLKTIKNKT